VLQVHPSDVASAQVESGSSQEKSTKSRISSMQLFGKSRSQGNVFARRGKDAVIEAAGSPHGIPLSPSRPPGKTLSETSLMERLSNVSSPAHSVVPVPPFKEVSLAHPE